MDSLEHSFAQVAAIPSPSPIVISACGETIPLQNNTRHFLTMCLLYSEPHCACAHTQESQYNKLFIFSYRTGNYELLAFFQGNEFQWTHSNLGWRL